MGETLRAVGLYRGIVAAKTCLFLLVVGNVCDVVAAPVRVAVVPVGTEARTELACAALQAAAAGVPDCAAVERAAIDAVLREVALQASANAGQRADKLRQVLPADIFVFAESLRVEEREYLRLSSVESQSGALLLARVVPVAGKGDALPPTAGTFVRDSVAKCAAVRTGGRYVAWLGVQAELPDEQLQASSRALTALIESRLAELPALALLDRSRLQHVGAESSISGLEQNLRRSVTLLDAGLRPAGTKDELQLTLRARPLLGGAPTTTIVRLPAQSMDAAASQAARAVAGFFGTASEPVQTNTSAVEEADLLAARARIFASWKEWGPAIEAAEAACALAPTQYLHRLVLAQTLCEGAAGDMHTITRAAGAYAGYFKAIECLPDRVGRKLLLQGCYRDRISVSLMKVQVYDPQEDGAVRAARAELASACDRFYAAQQHACKSYPDTTDYYWQSRNTQVRSIASPGLVNLAGQLGMLRDAIAEVSRCASTGQDLTEEALDIMFIPANIRVYDYFCQSTASTAEFRAFLGDLQQSADPMQRLSGWLAASIMRNPERYSTRPADVLKAVPAGTPDDRTLARKIAESVWQSIPSTNAYRQMPACRNDIMWQKKAGRLLAFLYLEDEDGYMLKPEDPIDTERLDYLARIIEDTQKAGQAAGVTNRPDPLLRLSIMTAVSTAGVTVSLVDRVVHALAVTGEEERARRIVANMTDPAARATLEALLPAKTRKREDPVTQPAPAPPSNPWDAYTVLRVGPGFARDVEPMAWERVDHEPIDFGAKLLHILPDGDVVHMVDVQSSKRAADAGEPLRVRLLRLQLPGCQVLSDRFATLKDVKTEWGSPVSALVRGNGQYYIGTAQGLFAVDERTYAVSRVAGVPGTNIVALAWLGKYLYVAFGAQAVFARYAPATGALEILASERAVAPHNIWDGTAFCVTDLLPDAVRDCLWMRTIWYSDGCAKIWRYDPGTNAIVGILTNMSPVMLTTTRRDRGGINGQPTLFLPDTGRTLKLMKPFSPPYLAMFRMAVDGENVFFSGPTRRSIMESPVLLREGGEPVRRDATDDGVPLHIIQGVAATDAGILLVSNKGETFLIRRKDRIPRYSESERAPLSGGPAEDALLRACEAGDVAAVGRALDQHADLRVRRQSGDTALTLAVANGHNDCVQRLLEAGADVNLGKLDGETPLHVAVRFARASALTFLLKHGADPDRTRQADHSTPLHLAAQYANAAMTAELIAHGAKVEAVTDDASNRRTALMLAAQTNACTVMTILLKNKARVNACDRLGSTALLLATMAGHGEAVSLLLNAKADAEAATVEGFTPAMAAAGYFDQASVLRNLLAHGANPRAVLYVGDNPSVFWWAARFDATNCAVILLEAGVDVNTHHRMNLTALHVTAQYGKPATVRFLVRHGANLEATSSHGFTPLGAAVFCDNVTNAVVLLELGAKVSGVVERDATGKEIGFKTPPRSVEMSRLLYEAAEKQGLQLGRRAPASNEGKP